jgi:hypothetical protein
VAGQVIECGYWNRGNEKHVRASECFRIMVRTVLNVQTVVADVSVFKRLRISRSKS